MTELNLDPTPTEVWKTLRAINVNQYTEKKGSLTYLSWAWAWQIMKDNFPDVTVEWHPEEFVEGADGSVTCMVSCTVRVGYLVSQTMFLPVMDNKMNAENNPDAREISDARQRCMVKCLAMLGLGVYIYAGEDLPKYEVDQVISLVKEVKQLARELTAKGVVFAPQRQQQIKDAVASEDSTILTTLRNELLSEVSNT